MKAFNQISSYFEFLIAIRTEALVVQEEMGCTALQLEHLMMVDVSVSVAFSVIEWRHLLQESQVWNASARVTLSTNMTSMSKRL